MSEALAAVLGRLFGSFVGQLLAVLLFVLIMFILWGLPWERLISKAGFTGRFYWFLLGLFLVPPLLGTFVAVHFREDSDLAKALVPVLGFSMYLGLLILAFCPWKVHRQLRQLNK